MGLATAAEMIPALMFILSTIDKHPKIKDPSIDYQIDHFIY